MALDQPQPSNGHAAESANRLVYRKNVPLNMTEVCNLYRDAPLWTRPICDEARMAKLFENSNLIITAWDGEELVGVARSVTDFGYCCYLSDLAIRRDHQKFGIGKELVRLTKEAVGETSMLLLMSAKTAMEYYPKIGFTQIDNGFWIPREKQ